MNGRACRRHPARGCSKRDVDPAGSCATATGAAVPSAKHSTIATDAAGLDVAEGRNRPGVRRRPRRLPRTARH